MTPRLGARAVGCALRALALVGLVACSRGARQASQGPFLSILGGPPAAAARAIPPGSIALALGGLPPGELGRLRERLEASSDTALRRALPALDLTSDDDAAPPLGPLEPVLTDLPALTAAANVLGAPWSAPGLLVVLGPTCDGAALRCSPLFDSRRGEDDVLLRRARAVAWSLSHAARVRVEAASRGRLLQSLHQAQSRPSSTIALVFGASSGAIDEAELEPLRGQARRALERSEGGGPERPWLAALAAAPTGWRLPIQLESDDVLVIPRLSALARVREFRQEIETASAAPK